MYEEFYGLEKRAFDLTPDTNFYFASEKHQDALNSLIYTIEHKRGFAMVTGEVGSGKTTVCRALLNKLNRRTRTALILNTHLTPKQLIATMLDEFEIDFHNGPKNYLLSRLNDFLIEEMSRGNNVVLIIDEAQNLTSSTLEEVRMLSNLETETEKLIQIILIGQPELREKVASHKLRQLRQRISIHYHLLPLDRIETGEYIIHRLKIAGHNAPSALFTKEAVDSIYQYSKGAPRLINVICDSALLTGFVSDSPLITSEITQEVIQETTILNENREAIAS